MKLLVFLAICAFTAAMVPRDRRAMNTEEDETIQRTETSSASIIGGEICAPQTPCRWSIYKPSIKFIELNITNTYCHCDVDKKCIIKEDDSSASAYIHKCRPLDEEENFES